MPRWLKPDMAEQVFEFEWEGDIDPPIDDQWMVRDFAPCVINPPAGEYERDASGTVLIPAKPEWCGNCNKGKVDAWPGGMSADDFRSEGPEFMDDYRRGVYDVPCPECKGTGIALAIDWDVLPKFWAGELRLWLRGEAEDNATAEAERRAGC